MDWWQAIVLGVVQGLAEFLPISSSGHLILAQDLLNISLSEDDTIAFDVALHAGTLTALILFFRTDLLNILRAGASSIRQRSIATSEQRLFWFIGLGTIPAISVYLLFSDQLRSFESQPRMVAIMLIVFSFVFIIAERFRSVRPISELRWWEAGLVGCGQALALVPGTSRSGATISVGLMLGFDRAAAARFSFLLSAPVVLAANVLSAPDIAAASGASNEFLVATIVGFSAAAISGYIAVAALLRFLGGHSLAWFAVYRIPVGLLFLAYLSW